jgi:predicted DNA-binding ribbon-helix-helix protein
LNCGLNRNGHLKFIHRQTSLSLEDEFWTELKRIANKKSMSVSTLVSAINDKNRAFNLTNLSSATRIYILEYIIDESNCKKLQNCKEL